MKHEYKAYYQSPVGWIEITGTENAVSSLSFVEEQTVNGFESCDYLQKCVKQLDEYFRGKRKKFTLNLIPEGTDFQQKVWGELMHIDYGETITYGDIADSLGDRDAVRAVGNANGKNKIPVIIPCHRVIGSSGTLTGYAGGMWRKDWLLKHEKEHSGVELQMELF